MNTKRLHVSVFLGSLLVAAVLSGVAAAGNPHGTAPGQAKNSAGAKQSAHVQGSAHVKGAAHVKGSVRVHGSAQVKGSAHVHGSAYVKGSAGMKHQSTVVTSISSTAGNAAGVKSSSRTSFNTFAAAESSATKSYGNGRTAGQIAEQSGAGASAVLYGPGNSQPHKTALCASGKMHLVDVHALKAHAGAASCAAASVGLSGSIKSSIFVPALGVLVVHGNGKGLGVLGAKAHGRVNSKARVRLAGSTGGVLGTRHTLAGSVTGQAKPAHAVVGTANFTG